MVIEFLQSHHSLVLSRCYSFGLFICSLFSSLPVPFPNNFRVFICSLFSSLPVPFPNNSVLLFVLIGLVSTHACPRLRLQPNPLVHQPRDSRTRPSPVTRIRHWISLDITVCRLTILDCLLFLEACYNKEYSFFIPEFRLAIGSCYPVITERSSQNGTSGPNSGSHPTTRCSFGTTSWGNLRPTSGNGSHLHYI